MQSDSIMGHSLRELSNIVVDAVLEQIPRAACRGGGKPHRGREQEKPRYFQKQAASHLPPQPPQLSCIRVRHGLLQLGHCAAPPRGRRAVYLR